MVTTTADLTVIHFSGGVRIDYITDRIDAYEGPYTLQMEFGSFFVPASVRGVAAAYAYMNDEPFEITLVPVVMLD